MIANVYLGGLEIKERFKGIFICSRRLPGSWGSGYDCLLPSAESLEEGHSVSRTRPWTAGSKECHNFSFSLVSTSPPRATLILHGQLPSPHATRLWVFVPTRPGRGARTGEGWPHDRGSPLTCPEGQCPRGARVHEQVSESLLWPSTARSRGSPKSTRTWCRGA